MKTTCIFVAILVITGLATQSLRSQESETPKELGINVGGFSHFPANKNFMTDYKSMVYVAPYVRAGNHEFMAGLLYPLSTYGIYYTDKMLKPMPGFIAGYKFYVFNVYGRENMFIHYNFEYLRYKLTQDDLHVWNGTPNTITETDMYINNVIGLGYNVFFDMNARFGLFYTLDYVISQGGFRLATDEPVPSYILPMVNSGTFVTKYFWNNLSNQIGFLFRLTPIKKKVTG
jgi:hypothetical protein